MRPYTRLVLETWRWKICDKFRLWRIGDLALALFPRSRMARKIWSYTLPF